MKRDRFVERNDIDYGEVLRRAAYDGDTDFHLLRCAECRSSFLFDAEVDSMYLDPSNLAAQRAVYLEEDAAPCPVCGVQIRARDIWAACRGEEYARRWCVPLAEALAGPWRWALVDGWADK